jgi:hypothetical protein
LKLSWDWRSDIKKRTIYEAVLDLKMPEFCSDDILSILLNKSYRGKWTMNKVAQHLAKHPMLESTGEKKTIRKGMGVCTEQVIYKIKRD